MESDQIDYDSLPIITDDMVLPELEDPDNWKERDPERYRSMQEIYADRHGIARMMSAREHAAILNKKYGYADDEFADDDDGDTE